MLAKRLLLLAGLLAPVFAQEFDDEFDFVEDELDERSGYDEHNGCTKSVQIVALPGGDSVRGELSYLQSLANDIQAAIPHSEIYEIGYPEGADPPTAIKYGTKHLNEHFRDYTKRCPHTGIVTLGYSVGGAAAMNVYCGNVTGGTHQLPSHFYKNVVANIIYGDLTYIPNLKYDAGTCTTSPGVVPREHPGKCAPFGKKTKSYCDEGDPECCGGDDPSVHFSYPATYDGDATNYVVGRWHHFQKHQQRRRHNKKGGK